MDGDALEEYQNRTIQPNLDAGATAHESTAPKRRKRKSRFQTGRHWRQAAQPSFAPSSASYMLNFML
jgi:hypothetical protein